MGERNILSPLMATIATGATWLEQANGILTFVITLLTLAWWLRLWWHNPKLRPPNMNKVKSEVKKVFPLLVMIAALLACGPAIAMLTGCASIRNRMVDETTTYQTNGVKTVVVRETVSTARAIWDAKQTIGQMKVANGKLHTVGLTDVESSATASNAVPMVQAVAEGVSAGILKSIKP